MNVKEMQEQYRSLMLSPLESQWSKLEDGREGVGAIVGGYELEAAREVDEDGKPTKKWSWMVKATSEISETPELYAAGDAATENGAKREASRAARKALKTRIDAAKAEAEKAEAEKASKPAKAKPRAKTAAKAK